MRMALGFRVALLRRLVDCACDIMDLVVVMGAKDSPSQSEV
eukprot:CAMPEP_0178455564 /NCGR_PEP_ID=MMETSP0689_2-20121128/45978_1 /TAXON_ID=160604 /ORGANISM="Amphidinium massartii, Strain CS-259" /LENGTH=40 /DNA_ID= /DNA_START= /DNA_END= /DNA_ORIENTATION=